MPAMLPRIAPEELAALRKGDEDALAHVFASHYYSLASEAEQEAVDGVLTTYRDGRALVRQKIVAGLGAFPDAVTFFRRIIKRGS